VIAVDRALQLRKSLENENSNQTIDQFQHLAVTCDNFVSLGDG